jgi:hypothetical protein
MVVSLLVGIGIGAAAAPEEAAAAPAAASQAEAGEPTTTTTTLWALVSGHWSAWQAARVEVLQKKEAERKAVEDMAGEIVDRVVQETTVEKQG